MSDEFVWRMLLRAPHHHVFGALVRVTSRQGRLCSVHDYGSAMVFTPGRGTAGPRLLARVVPQRSGTIVEILDTDPRTGGQDVAAAAESVSRLIAELHTHFRDEQRMALAAAS